MFGTKKSVNILTLFNAIIAHWLPKANVSGSLRIKSRDKLKSNCIELI